MRILISEDNDSKFNNIKQMLESNFSSISIDRVTSAKQGILKLMNEEYEFLIQDMQMPINLDDRQIDSEAGIYVLTQLKYRKISVKTIVCSSCDSSHVKMLNHNFNDIPFVLYEGEGTQESLISTMKNNTKFFVV